MNIELEIDTREKKLIQLLDIQYSIKQLDIGDILIKSVLKPFSSK